MKNKLTVLAARSPEVRDLEKKIKKASDAYYNTGKPIMSDRDFDKLVDRLKNLDPKSKVLDEIGAPVKKEKVKLPYFMGSLDKIKPDTAESWLKTNGRSGFYVTEKLDGVSILLVYSKDGVKAYTRGDGKYGQDISYLVPHFKIPEFKTNLVLRAEIIMPKGRFERWKSKFENPRNLVSGLVNRKSVHKATKDVDVVVYEQLSPRQEQRKALEKLKGVGFKVVPGSYYNSLTSGTLSDLLKKRKEKSRYEIDGLVVTVAKNNPLNTSGNPKWAIAFKENSAESAVISDVVKVHWRLTKTKALKPRVEIKPVRLAGVTVKFATGFNAKFIKDNRIGPGAKVSVVRSGDVIPYITSVTSPARKGQLPSPNEYDYEWTNSGVDIVVRNAKQHDSFLTTRILSFFKTIGVENFSEGLINRFFEHGFNTIRKIIRAKKEDFMKVEGVQEKLAAKIHANIQSSIKNVPLARLMAASGYFPGLAEKKLSVLVQKYPNIVKDYSNLPKRSLESRLSELEGYSSVTAKKVVEGLPKFEKFIAKIPDVTYKTEKRAKKKSGPLSGQVIVFTGYRDKQAELIIQNKGGAIGSSISSKTTILVVKDKSSTSSKTQAAKKLGVKIMDGNEFQRWLSKK